MLHKCANPQCASPFRKLSEGKLFLIEVDASDLTRYRNPVWQGGFGRRVEYYWLCDQCAAILTLSFEKERGMVLVPLPDKTSKMPAGSVRSCSPVTPVRPSEKSPLQKLA